MVGEVCEDEALLAGRGRPRDDARPGATFARRRASRVPRRRELDAALKESLAANIALIARPEVRARILDVMEQYSLAKARRG